MILKNLYFASLLLFCSGLTQASDEAKLTRVETTRLKDCLIAQKKQATDTLADMEKKLQDAFDKKNDAGGAYVKSIKEAMLPLQDIVSHVDNLLTQLRTGKPSYSLVVAQLKSLGAEPQKVLNLTGVREKVLAGQRVHPIVVEVDAINYIKNAEEIDEAFTIQRIGKQTDKRLMYISSDLTSRLLNKHAEIGDEELRSSIDILKTHLLNFKNNSTLNAVQKRGINESVASLEKLETERFKKSDKKAI